MRGICRISRRAAIVIVTTTMMVPIGNHQRSFMMMFCFFSKTPSATMFAAIGAA